MTQMAPRFDRLAIDGGRPVSSRPFAPWPHFDDEQIQAVTNVLQSGCVNYWTGEEGRCFEQEFSQFVGTKYAVAVANGTVALELALHAIDIGSADEVIVPSRTFIATASAVAMCGGVPVFADVDPVSGNITAESIEAVLSPRTKAIIVVHLAGWPCDMDEIFRLTRNRGLRVIEDCAQAHGATYKDRPVGSLGDVATFSFCQDKIMTTGGEGGMVTTNDADIWHRAWSFKDHGKNWDAVYNRNHSSIFRWTHESLGTNWRMTEMQSAIGRVALQRLENWLVKRRRHAVILNSGFSNIPALDVPIPNEEFAHSYYKYYVYLKPEWLSGSWTRDKIIHAIQAEGIPCGSGICPEVYLEKTFEALNLRPLDRRPNAKRLAESSLMFMVHPTLSDTCMRDICAATQKVLNIAIADHPASKFKAA